MVGKAHQLTSFLTIAVFLSTLIVPLHGQTKRAQKLYAKGEKALTARKYVGASVFFTDALAVSPDYTDAHFSRGYAFMLLGQEEAAIRDFKSTIDLAPDRIMAYVHLFPLMRDAGECGDVFKLIDRFEKHFPDNMGAAQYQRGLCHENMENIAAAISHYEQAAIIFSEDESLSEVLKECQTRLDNLRKL